MTLDSLSDLDMVFNAQGISEIQTPQGPGFKVVVPAAMYPPWTTDMKAVLAVWEYPTSPIGQVEDWTYKFMFPSSGNPNGLPDAWTGGLLWEWHTQTMSGNHLAIDGRAAANGPYFRFELYDPATGDYRRSLGPRVQFDHWYTARMQLKWSHGSDGWIKCWLDGAQVTDLTGATLKAGESPKLQFGFYADAQKNNEVHFAGIRRA
jgi:hypothetical protein